MFKMDLSHLPIIVLIALSVLSVKQVLGQEIFSEEASKHIVIEIDGEAYYRDPDWSGESWQTLSVGLPVQSNWLIQPIALTEVKVLCAGGETISIIRNNISSPDCIDIPGSDVDVMELIRNRGVRGDDSNRVVILSPWDRIATNTPFITWEGVAEYETYNISILQNGNSVFTENITGTSVQLSESDALARGQRYTIQVIPINAFNDMQFGIRGIADIVVITDSEFDEVDSRRQVMYNQTINRVSNADMVIYTEAWTLYEYALFSEAVDRLSEIVEPSSEEVNGNPLSLNTAPYPYILAGDSMRGIGDVERAIRYYNYALGLAKAIDEKAMIALILSRLAEMTSGSAKACYEAQAEVISDNLADPSDGLDLEIIGACD